MSDNTEQTESELAVRALGDQDGSAFSKHIQQGLYDRAADALAIKKVEVAQNVFQQKHCICHKVYQLSTFLVRIRMIPFRYHFA